MKRALWLVVGLIGNGVAVAADDDIAFFESKIRPLLVERCLKCHQGEKTSGGLALDTRQGWQTGGDSGPAIVPGKPDESLLIRAVRYTDENVMMPPKDGGGKLPDAEIALLQEWVRRGAADPRVAAVKIGGMTPEQAKNWWAFQPIVAPPAPARTNLSAIINNEIDLFCQSRLDAEGLEASPPADRRTLIRRATYDLTGLPPTQAEVDAFLADASPDAFLKVIDRLLESPQYGEQWGRHWLDVVRYADTAGENTDRPLPHMWRYRNWVFEALNRDLPYDEFVRLQIAGDILRADQTGSAYSEGIIATGYLAVARRFGHDSDSDIHLMHEDVIDNLGKAYLGLTLSCARCHDHKYDPVTTQDYYALYGILASSRFSFAGCEAKGQPRDLVAMLSPAEADELTRSARERREQIEPRLKEVEQRLQAEREEFQRDRSTKARVLTAADVSEGAAVTLAGGGKEPLDQIAIRAGEMLLFVVSPRGNHGADSTQLEWNIAEVGGQSRRWSVADLISDLPAGNPHSSADAAKPEWCFLDMAQEPALLDEPLAAIDGRGELKAWRKGDTPSVFVNTSDQAVSVWTTLPPRSFFVHPGPKGPVAVAWISPMDGVVAVSGRVRDVHPSGGDGVAFQLVHLESIGAGPALITLGKLAKEQADIIRKRDAEAATDPVMPVAFAVVEGEAKNAQQHLRGDPEKLGPEIPRRWIAAFGADPVPTESGSGRQELAEWIVRHPLSTRAVVNRIWQGHFGAGLVRTPNDFGARGELPTHPELLEWLCARFEQDGRRFKLLHRLIMSSAAYQRSSAATEAQAERDPENRWLSHFNRRRLSAEELRDSLLVVGGNLDRSPGEAHPFPPEKSWGFTQHNPFTAVYENEKRTAYQMVQRQRRHPFLALFDGADPNASTASRQHTTVPTQALFFLNDPFFHAQADRLAASLKADSDDAQRLRHAYRRILQREPDGAEEQVAVRFLEAYPGSPDDKWSACIRVLLAGNEFLHVD